MDEAALQIFSQQLDRALFLDPEYQDLADYDGPLPIGYGQTISQPSLVVEMTRLLDPTPNSRVLEIGTGSGYQTAFLARFSYHVYTSSGFWNCHRPPGTVTRLKFTNITFRVGDGSLGWPEEAPFDGS
jgi:protein-L-isoaspartate(D-aspartate) O-methyltransferase